MEGVYGMVGKGVVERFVDRNGEMSVHVAFACAAVMCMLRIVANIPACGLDVESFQGRGSRLTRRTFMPGDCRVQE